MTLRKFLLTWSDFNWLWIYGRLRPAQNANWSIFRVLGLTTLFGAVGSLIGLLLGLGLYHQPVGWLPWLLGLMGSCIGLCWFGVTALCWNQRADQLRTDPTLQPGLPKAHYPFFRWCLGLVYFVILGLVTPIALLVTVENMRGEIMWKRERARLVAAGEKLTFREVLGPEIPAAQNAGAAPVFAPFFDYQLGVPGLAGGNADEIIGNNGLVWRQSNQLARLERVLRTPAVYLPEITNGSRAHPNSPRIEIADWSAAYRKLVEAPKGDDALWAAGIKLPPPGNPARDVLAGLSSADPELAEICAAATLPRAQFPNHYEEAFAVLVRHLTSMKGVQQTLQLRCAAHLATGETDAAFADATNALNVANLLREDPLLISQLLRYAQINIAVNTVWQGLAEHRWSDTQLAEFRRRLAQFDCTPNIVLAMEGERAFSIGGLDLMISDPRVYDSFMGEPPGILRFLRVIPRSVLRHNQVSMVHNQSVALGHLRSVILNAPQTGLLVAIQSQQAKWESLTSRPYSPYTALFAMLAPVSGKAINKTARAETAVQLAIVACALERYRLAHGAFPERLEQLVPQSISTVPNDPMVNQPFRYERTDDGWFRLYSVGPNGKDDGGAMQSDGRSEKGEKDWPWPVPTRPEKTRLF